MTDFDRLLSLADALAKGAPVEAGSDLAKAVPEEAEKPLVPEDLEKLLAALRRIDPTVHDLLAPPDVISGQSPGRWAHLAIFSTIGHGTFGTVYRAHEPRLGVDVALELLSPSEPVESVKRFLDAGLRLVRLRHQNVVRCYGASEWAGCAGMWTELVKGQTLERLVRSTGRLPAEEAAAIGRTLCHAAAVIHQVGLPHVGITARNVAREASGRVVLMEPISRNSAERTESDVVGDIAMVVSFLVTALDETTMQESAAPNSLGAIIERSTSSNKARSIATLDRLESALATTTRRDAGAPHETKARLSRTISNWLGDRMGRRRNP